jgi:putative heme-binding domain-containing protein
MRLLRLVVLLAFFVLTAPLAAQKVQHGLKVPPGFEVTEFADSRLANDIYTLAIDTKGRVTVAGRGYVRILLDTKKTGKADRAIDFADGPKDGAMGLLWEGDSLFCTGDGGLRRYRIGADGHAAGPPELIRAMKTGGEHSAHAVRRGPDGWLYVLGGNNTGINRIYAQTPASPVREPVAGCVLRFSPDLKTSEIVADGFRNAYDMDFSAEGELFTFDSDNERCVSLPWYEPTRFYHVVPGGHHGWLNPQRAHWWRLPPYSLDVTAPVATLGRGSPTGVVCYRHGQFPPKYRGGFFLLDWTFGRIWFVKLKRAGASYTAEKEVFLQAVGDNGFAPTGAAIHPETGDLYVSIGGRGTRGAVYRIRYPAGLKTARQEAEHWRIAPRSLAWRPEFLKSLPRQAAATDALERLRALNDLFRHRQHFGAAALGKIIRTNWGHSDRLVRQATARLIAGLENEQARALAAKAQTGLEKTTFALGRIDQEPEDALARALGVVAAAKESPAVRRAAVRLVQRAIGDIVSRICQGMVWEGYSIRKPRAKQMYGKALETLRTAFPAGDADLDRELSRTLAMLEDEDTGTLRKVAERLTATSDPLEDIHYLIVLSRLRGPRSAAITARVAGALLALDDKIHQRRLNRDSNWPLRLAELHRELSRKDAALNGVLVAHREFGRPDHALWARCPGFDRRKAAEILLARSRKDKKYPWSAEVVRLMDSLPPEQSLPLFRRLWGKVGLDDVLLPLLARQPQPQDRGKFLQGLVSPQLTTVRLCLAALEKLPEQRDPETVLELVQALRRLPEGKEENKTREQLAKLLRRLTGQNSLGTERQAWVDWFRKAHPALADRLGEADGVDVASWSKRLAGVDWSKGDALRGRDVFTRASCASCHSGAQALGPDLRGVTGRFSRGDLFTAIVQPSKDVSPRYRTTMVVTNDAKVYQGIIIYEAVDSIILQTGAATTVRLVNRQVSEKRVTAVSLMPVGLLDRLSDRDLADLYAYLKGLGARPTSKR